MATDLELLEAWRAGDRTAGSTLFERHFDSICRFFANKVDRDVDDLVQRTFIACVEGKERFRGHSSFRTYLFGVAHNVLRSTLRTRKRENDRLDFGVSSVFDLGLSPTRLLANGAEQMLMLQALRKIPVEHQLVLELYYWEDMEASDLAEVLELPEGTVRSRIRRAKQLLEEQLRALGSGDVALESTLSDLDGWARSLRARVAPSAAESVPPPDTSGSGGSGDSA
ncbi:MAG: sigma-70 family RNA polymerase sigma factor [Nannocystaceae bacterium]